MRMTGFLVTLVIWQGVAISSAMAQELVIPDRQRLQSMSHDEYDAYREKMRSRMEGLSPAEQNLIRESGVNGREQKGKRASGSGYGQGYGTRNGQGPAMQGRGQSGGYGRGGGRHR